jgi:hypothetical protein
MIATMKKKDINFIITSIFHGLEKNPRPFLIIDPGYPMLSPDSVCIVRFFSEKEELIFRQVF